MTIETKQFSPLEGVRVLDLTVSIAGPYCTQILGALGADVVKIERPGAGDDARSWGPPFWGSESTAFLSVNSNKRSIALDLRSKEGHQIAARLMERSDVVVQNLRPGVVASLGLDFEQARLRNGRVVYCSIGAYGSVGPQREDPGYDPLMQAAAGIMSVTGEPGRPPVRAGVSVVDLGTGMWAALATISALSRRDEVGVAQLVETSLYETALNWMPYQIMGYLATGSVPGPQGSALGMIAPYQAFETSDGTVMVAAGNDSSFTSLCNLLGLLELPLDPRFNSNPARVEHRRELAEILQGVFVGDTAEEWLRRMRAAGVPAAPVQDVAAVVADAQTQALGILQELGHAEIEGLTVVGPPISVDGSRVKHREAPPLLGANGPEILVELGFSEAAIEEWLHVGVLM